MISSQQEVEDLCCVLEHIHTLPAPYNTLLAIAGHSKGAVVTLLTACQPALRSLDPLPMIINISGRFDASNLSHNRNRFTEEQYHQLDTQGSFVWMHYRAGAEPERTERRPYLVTKEEMDRHATRTMAGLKDHLPAGLSVLSVHGKADGTVPYDNSIKMDQTISLSQATSDLMLLEGAAHNWDRPGETDLLVGMISAWLAARLWKRPQKPGGEPLVDHLGTRRKQT